MKKKLNMRYMVLKAFDLNDSRIYQIKKKDYNDVKRTIIEEGSNSIILDKLVAFSQNKLNKLFKYMKENEE